MGGLRLFEGEVAVDFDLFGCSSRPANGNPMSMSKEASSGSKKCDGVVLVVVVVVVGVLVVVVVVVVVVVGAAVGTRATKKIVGMMYTIINQHNRTTLKLTMRPTMRPTMRQTTTTTIIPATQ